MLPPQSMVSSLSSGVPVTSFDAALETQEERLILALDWLTYSPTTHRDAILQSNVLMRLFLASGKLHAARTLLLGLPADVVRAIEDEELEGDEGDEHMHWRSFFDALAAHVRFSELWSAREEQRTRVERHDWLQALEVSSCVHFHAAIC